MQIVVAINPSASFGKRRTVGPRLVAALRSAGHEVTALSEPTFAALLAVARDAMAGHPDALVVVGGDGMVNLGANLVAETGVPLGIVPSGTGNDMARSLGIPHDNTDAAIRVLLDALGRPPRVIDAGRIIRDGETTWFGCVLSAGFDAVVNERANHLTWPKGPNRYNLAMLLELALLKPITYRLTLDGVESTTTGVLISVGNGVSLGGGMKVTPNALLDDGKLDVLVVEQLTRLQFLRIFPRVFKGTHLTDPRVTVHRVREVSIDADDVVAYADGERVGPVPVHVEAVSGALHVFAPLPAADAGELG